MAAEFELYKSGSQYRWRLQAGNNCQRHPNIDPLAAAEF